MKVSEVNTPAVDKIEPRTYYSEEQLSELLGIGKKKTPIKQSDVFTVLQNIETRKDNKAIPVRFDDEVVADISPIVAKKINMWVDSQGEGPAQKKGKLKAISTWDGMKKVAKILNFPLPKAREMAADGIDPDVARINFLSGLTNENMDQVSSPWTSTGKHPQFMDTDELRDEIAIFDEIKKVYGYLTPKEITRLDSLMSYLHDQEEMSDYEADTGAHDDDIDAYYNEDKENTYTVVHAKHGKEEVKATSSYGAAKKYADMKKLKSTAGVDAHLHTEEAVGDAMGMNKYGIAAVHKGGKFYAFKDGKMVGGPFDTIEQLADFQKKSVENEALDTHGRVEYNFTKADFFRNEDENMHTENAMELVLKFGTEEEIKRMEKIMTAHNTRGHILRDEQEERDALVRKYYPMLENVVRESSIMDPQTKQMIPEKDYIMKYVMAKHPEATKKLLQTQDLMDIYDDDLYMDLFDYFSEEMPYGTQKARDGDPVQYMQDELDDMGMFENKQTEGYAVLPPIPDKYQKRDGLEGPIMTRSGKVVYYDNVEGKYYDPDTDMYMTYDEWKAYDPELPIKDDKSMFKPEGNTVLDRLRLIVKDKSNAKVQLDDGHMLVDLYTASAITQVYDKVNDKNKAKMADMMNTKAGLLKLTNAVFSMLNKQPKVKENLIRETYRDLIIKRVMPEKITKDTEMGDVIKDFYKSDAPQFKGKSKAKRRQMAIAAKLSQEESKDMTRDEQKALLDKVLEFQTKDKEIKDIEAKEKALQDIQMNKHTKDDPELQKELQKRKAELDRLKKLAGV